VWAEAEKHRKREPSFARRNERFRDSGRKSLISLWREVDIFREFVCSQSLDRLFPSRCRQKPCRTPTEKRELALPLNSEKQYQVTYRLVKKKSIALPGASASGRFSFLGAALYSGRHKRTPLGYFERFVVPAYSVWLIVTGLRAGRLAQFAARSVVVTPRWSRGAPSAGVLKDASAAAEPAGPFLEAPPSRAL
jgi:hypothetical protein